MVPTPPPSSLSSGKQQANLTGYRLRELNMDFSVITHSTMERARETAELVHSHLPGVRMEEDGMLEEGGPAPPEPTISYWGLPERVSRGVEGRPGASLRG